VKEFIQQERGPAERAILDPEQRENLWRVLAETIEQYIRGVRELPVSSEPAPEAVRALLERFDFSRPLAAEEAVRLAADALARTQVHAPHPRYYGLFNPTPTTVGIAADALVAAFNPQLAAWKHSPFAVESERYVIRELGARFGYDRERTDGAMATGGSEANHTAVLAALANAFPEFGREGLRGLRAQPVFYVSAESHHSFHKAARMCGLGSKAYREIPVDNELRMEPPALQAAIEQDRREGFAPFLVVGTAGTTNAGAIDPLREIAGIAVREKLWFHADAAWGGAAALAPELRPSLDGIELADSITFDAHKWLSVPMGAGIFLTRHPAALNRTFHISAAYVPPQAEGIQTADPYESSMHWSRRFIGLKVLLSLAVIGWEGYAELVRGMVKMGEELRTRLAEADWEVLNPTPLPICCFRDRTARENSLDSLEAVVREVVASGNAWISTTRLRNSVPVLRACITSYRTNTDDLDLLVRTLNDARRKLRTGTVKSARLEA
jgi:glutamate/tyrosine decarboxylase-like PLP-dependent enzyme